MAKKKVKAVTLAGFWKNINKIAPAYIESESKFTQKDCKAIKQIVNEVNNSPIPKSIASSFVNPYMHQDDCQVEFSSENPEGLGSWAVKYHEPIEPKPKIDILTEDEDENVVPALKEFKEKLKTENIKKAPGKMFLDPIGLSRYVYKFKKAGKEIDSTPEIKDNFKEYRKASFMQEIAKMPEPYFIYIAVLQEIARHNDIVSIENRDGGYIKSDAAFYLSALWAFKEFEKFYLRIQHRHLRADYGIIWHEGEWVEDRKTKGYA